MCWACTFSATSVSQSTNFCFTGLELSFLVRHGLKSSLVILGRNIGFECFDNVPFSEEIGKNKIKNIHGTLS